jgi:hypothetical protein
LALRLTHEVAHVTRRHALKEMQVKVVDAMEIGKSVKPILDLTQQPERGMETLFGTVKATELMFQRFDQVQELEADACGAYLLVRQAGVDAKAAIQRFAASRTGKDEGKGWETSHPASEERELVMTAQVDPAVHSRVTRLKVGAAPQSVVGRDGSRPRTTTATQRKDTDPGSLPPTGAGPQAIPNANSLGSFVEKVRKSLPAASGVAPAQPSASP